MNHVVLFEKMIVAQLIMWFPVSLWSPKFHYHVLKGPMLSYMNPVSILLLTNRHAMKAYWEVEA